MMTFRKFHDDDFNAYAGVVSCPEKPALILEDELYKGSKVRTVIVDMEMVYIEEMDIENDEMGYLTLEMDYDTGVEFIKGLTPDILFQLPIENDL